MYRILMKRGHALGDVLLSTAVLHRLRVENPKAQIDVETICPTVFMGPGWRNPDLNDLVRGAGGGYNRIVDLDMAHETNRRIHQVDAYMQAAFGDHGGPKEIHFPLGPPPQLGVDWSRVITLHPNTSWRSRTIPQPVWQRVVEALEREGFTVVVLGTHIDQALQGAHLVDTRNKLDLFQQACAIEHSRAFVCGGSGLFLLSGATSTPVVVILTISKAEHCLPYRAGVMGEGYYPTIPDISCYGCNQEYGSATFVGCLRGDYKCIDLTTADTIIERALTASSARRVGDGKNSGL